jgi:hypothetical protein
VAEAGSHARWTAPQTALARRTGRTAFANHSEEQFARLLDFYDIRWEYEPTTFPLAWDSNGAMKESFAPDFYLPDFNLYIELTTVKPELSTRKKRKVRKLRELYPNVRIRLFRLSDFRRLMLKYGMALEKA